jgi:hypothetical protein
MVHHPVPKWCGAEQAAALSAPGASLAVAERRAVPARQYHSGRIRTATRRLDKDQVRRLEAHAQETPLLSIGPTDASEDGSVRTGLTCAIVHLSPRAANRGRRPMLEAAPVPARLVEALATTRRDTTGPAAPSKGGERCGTTAPPADPDCCSDDRDRCGCGMTRARCSGCCSRTHRAPPGGSSQGAPPAETGTTDYGTGTCMSAKKSSAVRNAHCIAANAAFSDQSFRTQWGTTAPPADPERCADDRDRRGGGTTRARGPGRSTRTHRAPPGG